MKLHLNTTRRERPNRTGRTASWPASLLPMRHKGKVKGVWLRLGSRVWYVTVWRR